MRMRITLADADYKKLQALASENDRKPNEMLVLLAQEALRRRLEGAERVRRFRDAMDRIYSGLDERTVRSLDARARAERRGRR